MKNTPQDGPNWGLILLLIVVVAMWSSAALSAYTEWSAA
jgi:hypothetical protein